MIKANLILRVSNEAEKPASSPAGTLVYTLDTNKLYKKTPAGYSDVCAGGSGGIPMYEMPSLELYIVEF